MQISHALSNVTIIYHMFVHLPFPPRREAFGLGFYTPLNIYARNVKVKERWSSLAVGAGEI